MTTTTTQTKLVAPEGVLRPRPYVTKGYRTHAEPNYWPQPEPVDESPKSWLWLIEWHWSAVVIGIVAACASGAALYCVAKLAGFSL